MHKFLFILSTTLLVSTTSCSSDSSESDAKIVQSHSPNDEPGVSFDDAGDQLEYCLRDEINVIVGRSQPGGPYPAYVTRCSDVQPNIYPACRNYDTYCRYFVKKQDPTPL